MIVPMKKANIIMRLEDSYAAVTQLRALGVLHVEHEEVPQGKDLSLLQEEAALLDNCVDILRQQERKLSVAPLNPPASWKESAQHIVDLWKRQDHLESYGRNIERAIKEQEKWGDFDPQEVSSLGEQGVNVKLYEVPSKSINKFPEGTIVKEIFRSKVMIGCVVISRSEFSVPFKEVALPKQGISAMRKRLKEDLEIVRSIKENLSQLSLLLPFFLEVRKHLDKEIEFHSALSGMASSGAITYISGFVPVDAILALQQEAASKKWGLLLTEPSADDNVPTLIRNPRWVSLISPVLKFLEVLPGYHELDVSLPFLIFFSIFFGILIGDAGYGLIYCLITFIIHQKAKKKGMNTSGFALFYILSGCAITWGILTGTFFGQGWVLAAGYKPLIPALNNEKDMQRFCFFLGALHLSIAHAWRAVIKFPSLDFLADIGWGTILWAAFFIANTLILGDSFPSFARWMVVAGVILVLFFTSPQRNILKAFGSGLGTLALGLMNNFTDVVSYVRLFAVGLAGVAISDAFNSMAGMLGTGNIFAILVTVLILIIGHTLAIVLGPVSVLVHGVRLNVLEFSGHAGVSWSGQAYKPLKE
jgi:V/A-type H+-transporting ATPase subunit I